MKKKLPKICVLSAAPLTIYFFLKPHLLELSDYFEVCMVYNPGSDKIAVATGKWFADDFSANDLLPDGWLKC